MASIQVIPILRIFDVDKALSFYRDWLGFQVDWKHRFSDYAPLYMQVSREGITLHLTEHHGDCSPGARVFITYPDLRALHAELSSRFYPYNRPGIEETPWNSLCLEVTDPFSNRLSFDQPVGSSSIEPEYTALPRVQVQLAIVPCMLQESSGYGLEGYLRSFPA